MIQDDKPIEGHEYDGIQEFNYPAPFWWQLFFYLSIVFGIGYYIHYELGTGTSSDQRLQEAMTEVKKAQIMNQPSGPDTKELLALVTNPEALRSGKDSFTAKCAACHGPDGGGLVGPNLTDKFWIHGKGEVNDIYKVVHDGVLDKGMPAWGALMSTAELNSVVAYVKSLAGSKPSNPKAPQGQEIK